MGTPIRDRPIEMSPQASEASFDSSLFRSDPFYAETSYDPEIERNLYKKWGRARGTGHV